MSEKIEGHELAKFGFIHVTDLKARNNFSGASRKIEAHTPALGSWGRHSGFTVVVTQGGKVWLTYESCALNENKGVPAEALAVLQVLCPNGDKSWRTAGCAITEGWEYILMSDLFSRLNNPEWNPTY